MHKKKLGGEQFIGSTMWVSFDRHSSSSRKLAVRLATQGSARSPFGLDFGLWSPLDSKVQSKSDSSLDSDSWVQIKSDSSLDSDSWVQSKSDSSLDSDSRVQSKSDSSLDSDSWLARAVGFAGGPRHLPAGLRLGKEQPPPQGGGRWS